MGRQLETTGGMAGVLLLLLVVEEEDRMERPRQQEQETTMPYFQPTCIPCCNGLLDIGKVIKGMCW